MLLETDIEDLKRDSVRKSKAIIVLTVLVFVLVVMLWGAIKNKPAPGVVAMTADMRVLPLPVLDEPFHNTERVLAWAAECLERAYSMSFSDLKEHPSRLTCMQQNVRRDFIEQLNRSGIIDKVDSERRVLRAVRGGAPSLQREGVSNGRYLWSIQMPLQLSFEGHQNTERSSIVVTALVGRVDLHEAPDSGLMLGKVDWVRGR